MHILIFFSFVFTEQIRRRQNPKDKPCVQTICKIMWHDSLTVKSLIPKLCNVVMRDGIQRHHNKYVSEDIKPNMYLNIWCHRICVSRGCEHVYCMQIQGSASVNPCNICNHVRKNLEQGLLRTWCLSSYIKLLCMHAALDYSVFYIVTVLKPEKQCL